MEFDGGTQSAWLLCCCVGNVVAVLVMSLLCWYCRGCVGNVGVQHSPFSGLAVMDEPESVVRELHELSWKLEVQLDEERVRFPCRFHP